MKLYKKYFGEVEEAMKRYYIFFETHEDNTYLEIYAGSDEKFEKRENMIKVQGENLW